MSNKQWGLIAIGVVVLIVFWIFVSPRSTSDSGIESLSDDINSSQELNGEDALFAVGDGSVLKDGSVLGEVSISLARVGEAGSMTLLFPVFSDSTCSTLVMEPMVVSSTQTPLNQIYKDMFSVVQGTLNLDGFSYTHPVGAMSGSLMFKEASINNRIARIDLIGSIDASRTTCSVDRVYAQLKAATTQFSTIDSTQVYLNGVLVN